MSKMGLLQTAGVAGHAGAGRPDPSAAASEHAGIVAPTPDPALMPGAMRRVVRGRRVQVEMLGADGSWSPVFCYKEPLEGGQDDPRGGPGDPR